MIAALKWIFDVSCAVTVALLIMTIAHYKFMLVDFNDIFIAGYISGFSPQFILRILNRPSKRERERMHL